MPIAVRRVLNSLLYNLNNGFHGKLRIKNNTFSFGLKNGFPLSGMKRSFKNICVNGRKWFPLARKSFSTSKISSVFKNCFPLMSVTVSGIRKKVSKRRFPLDKKSFFKSQSERLVQKYVSARRKKKAFTGRSLWKV